MLRKQTDRKMEGQNFIPKIFVEAKFISSRPLRRPPESFIAALKKKKKEKREGGGAGEGGKELAL